MWIAVLGSSRNSRSQGVLADSSPVVRAASRRLVAGFVLWCAQVCEVKECRHQLACALLPVTLLLLADASSLYEKATVASGSAV
jgi:hypothetical protein